MAPVTCQACGQPRDESAPVHAISVKTPYRDRPLVLIPDDGEIYTVCKRHKCPSLYLFINRAVESHEDARELRHWVGAVVLFDDWLAVKCTPNPEQRS